MDSAVSLTIIGVGVATMFGIIAVVILLWNMRSKIVEKTEETNTRLEELNKTVEGFNTRLGNAEATTRNLQRKVNENDNLVKLHDSEISVNRDHIRRILEMLQGIMRNREF